MTFYKTTRDMLFSFKATFKDCFQLMSLLLCWEKLEWAVLGLTGTLGHTTTPRTPCPTLCDREVFGFFHVPQKL